VYRIHGSAKNYEAAGHCAREQKNWEEAVAYFRKSASLYTENGTVEKVQIRLSFTRNFASHCPLWNDSILIHMRTSRRLKC
jgi:hypothetical protein